MNFRCAPSRVLGFVPTNSLEPFQAWSVVDFMWSRRSIVQIPSASLLESSDPFVPCFSADSQVPAKHRKILFGFVPKLNKLPTLDPTNDVFPWHIAWKV